MGVCHMHLACGVGQRTARFWIYLSGHSTPPEPIYNHLQGKMQSELHGRQCMWTPYLRFVIFLLVGRLSCGAVMPLLLVQHHFGHVLIIV